jgi:hypothetical protein
MRGSLVLSLFVFLPSLFGEAIDLHNLSWVGQTQGEINYLEAPLEPPCFATAILQKNGTHDFVLTNAPSVSWWEARIGHVWVELPTTRITNDIRVLRLHNLPAPIRAESLRLCSLGTETSRAQGELLLTNHEKVAPWAGVSPSGSINPRLGKNPCPANLGWRIDSRVFGH